MIVNGNILTNKGYVDVNELTKKNSTINRMSRPLKILRLKKNKVDTIIKFKNNPKLVVSLDTKIVTIYGAKDVSELADKNIYIMQRDGRIVSDTITIQHLEEPVTCYDIGVENDDNFFCENYPLM